MSRIHSVIAETRYYRLVLMARRRGKPTCYAEQHHILPRSAGGANTPENLVWLTAREHFLAHWLLFRMYRTPAMARAFRLMVNDQMRRRGRDYAAAREAMALDMRGDKNVSRRPDVRRKLRENAHSPFAGKKRPEHALLMQRKGLFRGVNNPFYGQGERQRGSKNHMARPIVGIHIWFGVTRWDTLTSAAASIGVTIQAVAQAIKKRNRSRGWRLEAVA